MSLPLSLGIALPLTVIVLAGGMAALQAPMNAALGRGLGSPTAAAAVSFAVGFVALAGTTLALGHGGTWSRLGQVNGVLLLGGVLGAFYVWAILWVVPQLGIVTAVSAMILGQLVVALILDAVGPFGLAAQGVTWPRVAAIALVASGLALSRA